MRWREISNSSEGWKTILKSTNLINLEVAPKENDEFIHDQCVHKKITDKLEKSVMTVYAHIPNSDIMEQYQKLMLEIKEIKEKNYKESKGMSHQLNNWQMELKI